MSWSWSTFLTIDHGVNSRVSWSWSVPYPPPPPLDYKNFQLLKSGQTSVFSSPLLLLLLFFLFAPLVLENEEGDGQVEETIYSVLAYNRQIPQQSVPNKHPHWERAIFLTVKVCNITFHTIFKYRTFGRKS